jgi:hypothetical protein
MNFIFKDIPPDSPVTVNGCIGSETSVNFRRNTRRHMPEDRTLRPNFYWKRHFGHWSVSVVKWRFYSVGLNGQGQSLFGLEIEISSTIGLRRVGFLTQTESNNRKVVSNRNYDGYVQRTDHSKSGYTRILS